VTADALKGALSHTHMILAYCCIFRVSFCPLRWGQCLAALSELPGSHGWGGRLHNGPSQPYQTVISIRLCPRGHNDTNNGGEAQEQEPACHDGNVWIRDDVLRLLVSDVVR
jgi:hypothetical protein